MFIGVNGTINLYSGLGCLNSPLGCKVGDTEGVSYPRASYQESDVPYYGHIVSIIEQSSIMKNNQARIEVKLFCDV
jgi:hypothetical protein